MRELLEQLLRAAEVPNPARAESLWSEYRLGGPGADAAFATLLAWYGLPIYRCIWGFVRSDEAEDVFQDVLARLHQQRERLATFDHALRWLYTVAVNRCVDAHRRATRRRVREAKAAKRPEDGTPPEGGLELREALCVALSKLPKELKTVVSLVFFAEMELRDAARVLGVNRDTVAARKNEALGRLQNLVPAPVVLAAGGTLGVAGALVAQPPPLSTTRLSELASAAWAKAAASGGWPLGKATAVATAVLLTGGLALGGWALTRNDTLKGEPTRVHVNEQRDVRPQDETLQEKHRRIFETEVRPKAERAIQKLAPNAGDSARIVKFDVYDTRLEVFATVQRVDPPGSTSNLKVVFDSRDSSSRVYVDIFGTDRWKSISPAKPLYFTLGSRELVVRFEGIDDLLKAFREVNWADPRMEPEHAARLAVFRKAAEPYLGTWYEDGDPAKRFTVEFDPNHVFALKYTFHTGFVSGRRVIDLKVAPDGRLESLGLGEIKNGVWTELGEPRRVSTRQPTKQ